MRPTATSRTLTTPELLELILSHLPGPDVLVVQCTCKAWRALISSSPSLQTTLYFRTPTSTPTSDTITLNPFITSNTPFLLTPGYILNVDQKVELDRKFSQMQPPVSLGTMTDAPTQLQYSTWIRNPEAWRFKDASWRQMHVANPPVTRLVVITGSCGMNGVSYSQGMVEFGARAAKGEGWLTHGGRKIDVVEEGGLRMGLLYDYLYQHCFDAEECPELWFEWDHVDEWEKICSFVDAGLVWQRSSDGHKVAQKMEGLTLVVDMFWSNRGCTDQYEPIEEKFESEDFARVEVGPLRKTSSGPWD